MRHREGETIQPDQLLEQLFQALHAGELDRYRRATSAAQRRAHHRYYLSRLCGAGGIRHAAATALKRQVRSPVHQQSTSFTA